MMSSRRGLKCSLTDDVVQPVRVQPVVLVQC
uniref:Uncharacterized protein n=1 Tax=Arundo donax TaxID=35708 RepID=A0A0A9CB30_ARUDO